MATLSQIRTKTARERWLAAADKFTSALVRRAYTLKFDPNQPRVPAGQTGGGQWTSGISGSDIVAADDLEASSARRRSGLIADCWMQYRRDIFQCKMVGSPSCYSQAMVRLVACENGSPIPPLNY